MCSLIRGVPKGEVGEPEEGHIVNIVLCCVHQAVKPRANVQYCITLKQLDE